MITKRRPQEDHYIIFLSVLSYLRRRSDYCRLAANFMTSHLDSYGTTDIKPQMLSDFQTGNEIQHNEYNIRGIAHVHANRRHFHVKTTIAKIYLYMENGPQEI